MSRKLIAVKLCWDLNVDLTAEMKVSPAWNTTTRNLQDEAAGCATWNIPSNPAEQAAPQLLDLDNHQINSGDLQNHLNEMNITNLGQLPDFNNLSLTEIDLNSQNQNMSDSLTNIVNAAVDKNLGGQ